MFFVPGWLIALVTFPGVIIHEFAHQFFADLCKVKVFEVCYFRRGNPAGYVIHERINDLKAAFLISVGPFIINTILCAILTFPANFPVFMLADDKANFVFYILVWLGFSIGMHAFPSQEDMDGLISAVSESKNNNILLILAKFFAVIFKTANSLSRIWFDLIYAYLIAQILPNLFLLYAKY